MMAEIGRELIKRKEDIFKRYVGKDQCYTKAIAHLVEF
jgi:hypothetical protein